MRESKLAYHSQRSQAKQRGIGWDFTYPQWLAWWGDDLMLRGSGHLDLQMQRIADTGPYHPDNVRKGVPQRNADTKSTMHQQRVSVAARASILAAEMNKPSVAKIYELDELTDDQKELLPLRHFGKYSVYGV